jgi:hypothetical protein
MSKSCRSLLLVMLFASMLCGCANFMHELKPHRLHRWNRGPGPSVSPDFSQMDRQPYTQVVRFSRPAKPAAMSANSAEVSLARGQNE